MSNNIGTLLVELGVNTAAFVEGMDKATYKAKQSAKEIGNAFKGLGNDISGLLSSFGGIGGAIGGTLASAGETIGKVAGQMGSLSGMAGAAVIGVAALGAAAVAAGVGLAALAKEGAEVVHNLSMVSQKTGISIGSLQGLQAAGSTVGLSLDAMVMGFRRFDQAISGTGRGTGAAALILKNLGVTARDNEEALNQVADAFSKMEDGPKKAADAVALFGRAGLNLIPLLNKGREGIAEFNRMVDEYGPKIGKDAVKADEDFLVSQAKMSLAWQSFTVDIEKKVLPALTAYINSVTEAMHATHNLGDEVANHPWESIKEFGKGAGRAVGNKKPWWEEALGPAATIGEVIGGGLGGVSAAADTHGMSAQDQQAKQLEETKKRNRKLADDQAQAEKQVFTAMKDGGAAAATLRETKEAILQLTQEGDTADYTTAAALQAMLPAMEKAAKLEKERNDYKLDPKKAILGPSQVEEMNDKLTIEIQKQVELAAAIDASTGRSVVAKAIAEEAMKIREKDLTLATEESRAKQERDRQDIGTQRYADADARYKQIIQERKDLQKDRNEMLGKAGEAALGGEINTSFMGMSASLENLKMQRDALKELGQSYTQTAAEVRAAEIDKMTEGESKAYRDVKRDFDNWMADHKGAAADMNPFNDKLREEVKLLGESKVVAGQISDQKLANHLEEERIALKNDADAWAIDNAAIGEGIEARIQAERAAAMMRARKAGATEPEVQLAGNKAEQDARQKSDSALKQEAVQMDINKQLSLELEKLDMMKKLYGDSLELENARRDAIIKAHEEWDKAALASGDFNAKMAAALDTLVLKGQNFWGDFAQSGIQAVQGIEDEIAKLVTTGKGNFKDVAKGLEESFLKNSMNFMVSKGASSILDATGLGDLLPQKRDGSSASAALYTIDANNPLGSMLPTAAPGITNLPNLFGGGANAGGAGGGIGGFLGSLVGMLPFLAEGGDVTPGKAYVVGEEHPEFFVPSTPGTIHPSLKMGGTETNIVQVHFNGVTDHDSFRRNESQISQRLTNAVARGNGRR